MNRRSFLTTTAASILSGTLARQLTAEAVPGPSSAVLTVWNPVEHLGSWEWKTLDMAEDGIQRGDIRYFKEPGT